MVNRTTSGILRRPRWSATGGQFASILRQASIRVVTVLITFGVVLMSQDACGQRAVVDDRTEMTSFVWDFGRHDDPSFQGTPENWKRRSGIGYPNYVTSRIVARDLDLEKSLVGFDTIAARAWTRILEPIRASQESIDQRGPSFLAADLFGVAASNLPALLPSVADALVDRYLRIDLDGGQFATWSPELPASRRYQYRFSCQVLTRGLEHDSALAQFVFLNNTGEELASYTTEPLSGSHDWTTLTIPAVQPPFGATKMMVRLKVVHNDDGLEDIRGTIGFDNVRIDQHPRLAVTTDRPLGVYRNGESVVASARIMGLPDGDSNIQFALHDHAGQQVASASRSVTIEHSDVVESAYDESFEMDLGTAVTWELPPLGPGFYRISAFVEGGRVSTLASETTIAVIDQLVTGPPHGCFGWTLPEGHLSVPARELASWLSDYGVAWAKYPCWLPADDIDSAEDAATVFSRLQEAGIETIGVLDFPPESEQHLYELRGRRDLVAAQLFRDELKWRPLLEPVMTRMTLKVRRWQLGADRDHSFLGRPRLNESIRQISVGLQGYGQPIDVAISWPWEETQLQDVKVSWQAECRSSDPPLGARELDAYLSQRSLDSRPESPSTWVLIDPISSNRYGLTTRVQDLILRMATVRGHRVQAAFVSDPHDPQHGLLRADGRPDELLLPWRTASRLIGNLRRAGSLQLRGGTSNIVFTGAQRSVVMLWSAVPSEEKLYLGEDAKVIDAWGRTTDLPIRYQGNQPVQVVRTGPEPVFIVGADADLLAFRMSVRIDPSRLDTMIGKNQRLAVTLSNPMEESLVGDLMMAAPESWSVENPKRNWQLLAGRTGSEKFEVAVTNTAMIGEYEVPLLFNLDTVPPKRITVYRNVNIGPDGIDVETYTRLMNGGELQVRIELTNRTNQSRSFHCRLFPQANRQFQERDITLGPGATIRRDFYWTDAESFVGKEMTLRAVEQDSARVINYRFKIRS